MDFEKIYDSYFKPVLGYIMCRVKNLDSAEEISCRVWVKVLNGLGSFNSEKGSLDQWLFGVARNEVNMYFRLYHIKNFFSLTGKEDVYAEDEVNSAQMQAERSWLNKALVNAVKSLSAKEQDLITLKFYSGLNNREIARLTGLSESNVGTIVNRAVNKLRDILKDEV